MFKKLHTFVFVFVFLALVLAPTITDAVSLPPTTGNLPAPSKDEGEGPLSAESVNVPEPNILVTKLEDVSAENVDPKMGLLHENGGHPFTHVLLSDCPAIDGGNPGGCTDHLDNLLTTDQRGFPRVGRCDIGAHEWQPGEGEMFTLYLPLVMRSCPTRLFFDDFSQPAHGWYNFEDVNARYEYLNGEYRILAKDRPNDTWAMSFPGYKYTDYVLQVDVRNADGATGHYGFAFEMKDDGSQVYFLLVDNSGNYVIFRSDHVGWLSNGYSPFIRTGIATNHLKLERNGNQIWAYANGELLVILNEPTSTEPRYVGLSSIATVATVDARFDNFTVEPISCGASYNYPVLAGEALDEAAVELAPPAD